MSYLKEVLPNFNKGAKIRRKGWEENVFVYRYGNGIYFKDNEYGRVASISELYAMVTNSDNDWEVVEQNCADKGDKKNVNELTKEDLDEIYKEESEWYIDHCTSLFNHS